MSLPRLALSVAFSLGALAAGAAAQNTWYVDVHGTPPGSGSEADPYTSIQYAITQETTLEGDTILVRPGTYIENVNLGGKSLAIESTDGAEATIIDGGSAGACVIINGVTPPPRLEGFTLTHGSFPTGGGLHVQSSGGVIRDCVIRGNTASIRGGGVWIGYGSPVLERCVIADNAVVGPNGLGGGMYSMYGFTMSVLNCTITRNTAAASPGYKSEFSTGATVRNSILRGNAGADFTTYASNVTVSYCDVGGGFAGTGNFDADPRFWNPAAGDWHLRPGSPCIDAGDPAGPNDPDGSVADVGASPFDPGHCGLPVIYCTAKVNSLGCTPAIGFSGSPSATSPDAFLITASSVINNKTGFLFYGYAVDDRPWQGGTLCVHSPLKRTTVQNSGGNPPPNDCSGSYTFDFNARIRIGVDPLLVPGRTVYAQWYHRDPPASFGVGITDAVEFTICP